MSLLEVYNRYPLSFERGFGCYLYDSAGEKHLDFYSGIGVNSLGHNHKHVVDTITRQAQKILHLSNMFPIYEQERLASRLVANSFSDRVFVSNSGAEAVECAIKATRRYHYDSACNDDEKSVPSRYEIITFTNSFHGRTMACISASEKEKLCQGFSPLLPGFIQAELNNEESVKNAFSDRCAGIMLEPIQGEAGIVVADKSFLQFLRNFCTEHGLLLIFDEIQCGMGRSGSLFHYENMGVIPDIMVLAKGLGAGIAIGATLMTEEVGSKMPVGSHGSTFGGNPLACSVANAVLDIVLAKDFLSDLRKRAIFLHKHLDVLVENNRHTLSAWRGVGLMLGLVCKTDSTKLQHEFFKNHLLTAKASGNVIRLLPPLIISEKEIEAGIIAMNAAIKSLRS